MEPVIRTVGLTKHFGRVVALEDLDLEVRQGEIFGFLGPNGAGKSTTLRLLLGLIRPTRGEAWIGGIPVSDVRRAHRLVSYVPGDVAMWPQLTGRETLELLGNLAGHVDEQLREELVERFQLEPDKRVRAYSKGNRQKVALVAAFMTRPEVLLLDEPTAGLDPLMEAEFQSVVREAVGQGQTVFLSSHLLDEVEDLCSRVAILREGRLVDIRALEELHELSTTIFEATLARPAPDLVDVPGVTSVETTPTGLRATVTGAPDAFLAALLPAGVERLHSHTPTLEQIFLTYYQASAGQRRAVEVAHGSVGPAEVATAGGRGAH